MATNDDGGTDLRQQGLRGGPFHETHLVMPRPLMHAKMSCTRLTQMLTLRLLLVPDLSIYRFRHVEAAR